LGDRKFVLPSTTFVQLTDSSLAQVCWSDFV
jgi:hypothetical protein